jgi:hypothetical protein
MNRKNKLTMALTDFLEAFVQTVRMPSRIGKIYLKLNPRYQRASVIIYKCLNEMIEHEQSKTPEEIDEQKRTSLIVLAITSVIAAVSRFSSAAHSFRYIHSRLFVLCSLFRERMLSLISFFLSFSF